MFIKTAFNFSGVVQRLVCRFSGLRLVASRWFLIFLASGPCVASASSYCFHSAAPPRWRCAFSQFVPVAKFRLSVLASGSNISVKPTRLRRSAYLARYASLNSCQSFALLHPLSWRSSAFAVAFHRLVRVFALRTGSQLYSGRIRRYCHRSGD